MNSLVLIQKMRGMKFVYASLLVLLVASFVVTQSYARSNVKSRTENVQVGIMQEKDEALAPAQVTKSIPSHRTPGKTGMSGTYTIGTSGTYTSLAAFCSDLNTLGVDGNVTGQITSDLTESGTSTILALTYGSGGPFSVTISPSGGSWTVQASLTTALISLNGASNVTIDGLGKTLTLRNSNATTGSTVSFVNDANHNTVTGCNLEGSSVSPSATVVFGTSTGTGGNSNNTISSNDIRDRSDATGRPGIGLLSLGTSTALNKNNSVTGNNVYNFTSSGINANTNSGAGWVITGNSLYCTYAAATSQSGIVVTAAANENYTISNNYVGGSAANCGGSAWSNTLAAAAMRGISATVGNFVGSINSTISGNTIQNYALTGTGAGSFIGIVTTGKVSITGNTVGHASTANSITGIYSSAVYGIQVSAKGPNTVSNNTIANLKNTGTTSALCRGIVSADTGVITISGNTIHDLAAGSIASSTTGNISGIVHGPGVANTVNLITISGNTIYNLSSLSTTGNAKVGGILMTNMCPQNMISGNLIYNFDNAATTLSATAPPAITGIHGRFTISGPYIIQNNMIALGGSTSSSAQITGIQNQGDNGPDEFFAFGNTVVISGTGSGTNTSFAFLRGDNSGTYLSTPIRLEDNILINTRTGAGSAYAVGNIGLNAGSPPSDGWDNTASDYNDLYTTNSATLGNWGTTDQTFANWQTTSGGDAHSLNASVNFVSSTDLHLASTSEVVENVGTPIPAFTDAGGSGSPVNEVGLLKDYDGATRSLFHTDIGADEDAFFLLAGAFDLVSPTNGFAPSALSPTLTWQTSTNAVSYDLYLDATDATTLYASNLVTTQDLVGPLNINTTYHWKVVAKNEVGTPQTSTSTFTFTTGQPPAAPTGLSVGNLTESSADLTWTDASSNEDGFRVFRSLTGIPGSYSQVGSDLSAGSESYSDAGPLPSAATIYYQVVAFSTVQGESAPASATGVTHPVTPGMATFGAASYSQLTVITNRGSNSASALLSIKVTGSEFAKTSFFVQANGSLGATEVFQSDTAWGGGTGVAVTGLYPGISYTFNLKAKNSVGDLSALGADAVQATTDPLDVESTPLFEQFGIPPLPPPGGQFPPPGWKTIDVDGDGLNIGGTIGGAFHLSTTNLYSAGGAARIFAYDDFLGGPGGIVHTDSLGNINSLPDNDYMFTLPMALTAGTRYNVTWWYRTVPGVGHNIAVVLATHQTVESIVETVSDEEYVTFGGYTQTGVNFAAPTTGTYYIGWYDHTPVNGVTIRWEDVKIEKAPDIDLLAEKVEQIDRFPYEAKKAVTPTHPITFNDDLSNRIVASHSSNSVKPVGHKTKTHPFKGNPKIKVAPVRARLVGAQHLNMKKHGGNNVMNVGDISDVSSTFSVANVGQNDVASVDWNVEWATSSITQPDVDGVDINAGDVGLVDLTFSPPAVGTYYTGATAVHASDGNANNNTVHEHLTAYPADLYVIDYDQSGHSPPFRTNPLGNGAPYTAAVRFTVPDGQFLHLAGFNTFYNNIQANGVTPVTDSLPVQIWGVAVDTNGNPDYSTVGPLLFSKMVGGDDYLWNLPGFGQFFTIPLDDADMSFGPGDEFFLSIGFSGLSSSALAASDTTDFPALDPSRSYLSGDNGLTWTQGFQITGAGAGAWYMKGLFEPMNSVSANVSDDLDGDINTTGDQSPLGGIDVTLNDGPTEIATLTTDDNGNVLFDPISYALPDASTYSVSISAEAGITNLTQTSIGLSLNGGQNGSANFFTFTNGAISGSVYRDVNGDGSDNDTGKKGKKHSKTVIRTVAKNNDVARVAKNESVKEAGKIVGGNTMKSAEPRIDGRTINLKLSSSIVATTVSGVDGSYSFSDVAPGTYTIEEELPDSTWVESQSVDDIAMESGGDFTNNDLGSYQTGSVSGTVYEDMNANGTKDAGEPGLTSWQIDVSGANSSSVNSDANGVYTAAGLAPGTYSVGEVLQNTYFQSEPSNGKLSSYSGLAIDGNGTALSGKNFGNYRNATVSGTVYTDQNGNATRDSANHVFDPGTVGVKVRLNGQSGGSTDSTVTDANGAYSFSAKPGAYTTSIVVPSGSIQTKPLSNGNYGDTVVSNGAKAGNNFGVFALGSIGGTVYNDANHNSAQDSSETGLSGWVVTLTKGNTAVGTDTTDNGGGYSFSGLTAGDYSVSVAAQAGYVGFENAAGASVTVISGTASAPKFGWLLDPTTFRTFKLSTGATDFASKSGSLALKAVKGSKTAKYIAVSGSLNLRMAAEYVFVKAVTAVKGTVMTFGVDLGKTDAAKTHGWLTYKNTTGIGKFVGVAQTGAAYPIDSLTHNNAISAKGKRSGKAYTKGIAPTNKMSNKLWGEGTIFKFNLMASQMGVTPSNFGALTLDTAYTLFGKNLQGATLTTFATYVDSLMTFWSEHHMYDTTGTGRFDSASARMLRQLDGLTTILSRINNGFYAAVGTVDSNSRGTHDYMDSAAIAAKMKYALVLRGSKTAKDGASFLKHTPGKVADALDFASRGSYDMPVKVALGQNYPNPFNPTTTINVGIPENMDGAIATLKVYNVLGQEVATVINNEAMSAGDNAVTFDAAKLSSGVYFYRLSLNGGEVTAIKKMMLLK